MNLMLVKCETCESEVEWDGDGTSVSCPDCGQVVVLSASRQADSSQSMADLETVDFKLSSAAVSGDQTLERIDHFEIIRRLGHGGFAEVFLARDLELRRDVAIKIPRSDKVFSKQSLEMFREEAQVAAALRHPSIVNIYQVGATEACPCYIVMEYIEGKTLAELANDQVIDGTKAARFVIEIAAAVQYAHSHGVVHRDIKPSNIMVNKAGKPIILDFGLGLREEAQWQRKQQVAGTPAYMPPEQAKGDLREIDGRADVWSLGVMLYQLLAGRLPFGGSANLVFSESMRYDPKPLRQYDPSIPVDLETIVLRCLSKNPADRYATAKDLSDALRRWLEATAEQTPRRLRSHLGWGLQVAVLVMLVAGLAFASFELYETNSESGMKPEVGDVARSKEIRRVPLTSKLPLNSWSNLFDQEPVPFAFPLSDVASHWMHAPERQSLHLSSRPYGFITVGHLDSEDCEIRLDISKNQTNGKSGLYFGRHAKVDQDGVETNHCQAIVLEYAGDGRQMLTRELYRVVKKKNGDYYPSSMSLRSIDVTTKPHALIQQAELQVRIRNYRLVEVTWNGALMSQLVDEKHHAYVHAMKSWTTMNPEVSIDCSGEFGCLNGFGDTTFEMFFARPNKPNGE